MISVTLWVIFKFAVFVAECTMSLHAAVRNPKTWSKVLFTLS
jgi:hypothetical protein